MKRILALFAGLAIFGAVWATVESVTYISDLNTSNPGATDPKSEGDDHLRNIKTALKNTFPNITGAVTPTHTELNYVGGVTSALQTQLNTKAPLASPTLTGTPAAPTASAATSTTQIATTAFVQQEMGWVYLNAYTASSSATIDIALAGTYDEYVIVLRNVTPATDGTNLLARYSIDGGSSFLSTSTYDYAQSVVNNAGTSAPGGASSQGAIQLAPSQSNSTSAGGVSGVFRIYNVSGTTMQKNCIWSLNGRSSTGSGNLQIINGAGTNTHSSTTNAAVNYVRFLASTGNLASGKLYLYGVKKS